MNSTHAMIILALFGFALVYAGFYFQHRDNVKQSKVEMEHQQMRWSTPEQLLEAINEQ